MHSKKELFGMFAVWFSICMVVAVLGSWWKTYQYQECKKTGHSTAYCVMKWGGR